MYPLNWNLNLGGRFGKRADFALEHLFCSAVDGKVAQTLNLSPSPLSFWDKGL